MRLNYGWCCDKVGKEEEGEGGGGGEEEGRNKQTQVGKMTQKSGVWMQLFQLHFAPAPPPGRDPW